jgi:hypothetical protein
MFGELAKQAGAMKGLFTKALVMVSLLWEKHPPPPDENVICRECWIEGEFNESSGIRIPLCGILDKLNAGDNGEVWVEDHKTSGREVDFILTGYQFSLQCRIYRILACMQTGREPVGFVLNYLRTPAIKFCAKDKDFDGYLGRCRDWYAKNTDNSIRSFAIRYTEPLLTPELRVALLSASLLRRMPPNTLANFPKDVTTSFCRNYERVCDFYRLCSSPESAWPQLIEDEYVVEPPEDKKERTVSMSEVARKE